jgi:hypothetical protein
MKKVKRRIDRKTIGLERNSDGISLILPEQSQKTTVKIENRDRSGEERGRTKQVAIALNTAADSKKLGFLLKTIIVVPHVCFLESGGNCIPSTKTTIHLLFNPVIGIAYYGEAHIHRVVQ